MTFGVMRSVSDEDVRRPRATERQITRRRHAPT